MFLSLTASSGKWSCKGLAPGFHGDPWRESYEIVHVKCPAQRRGSANATALAAGPLAPHLFLSFLLHLGAEAESLGQGEEEEVAAASEDSCSLRRDKARATVGETQVSPERHFPILRTRGKPHFKGPVQSVPRPISSS